MIRDPQRSPRSPRRLVRPRSAHARFVNYLLVLGLIASAMAGLLPIPAGPTLEAASAHHGNIKLPVPGGEAWRVSQGYNTSPAEGGSHYSCDPSTLKDQPSQTRSCSQYWQYKYSLDLVAVEGTTAGRTVVSPVNGTIRWIDEAYGGMSIDLGDGFAYAFFHASLAPSLRAGQTLTQGQYLGTVATAGNGGNGGFPHLHVTIWQTNDGGNWSRIPVPFSGAQAIEGMHLGAAEDTQRNQHRGVVISSSNVVGPASEQPPAPPLLTSPPHGTTYRVNSHIASLGWQASSGASDYQVVINDGAIVSPWVSGTSWTTGTLSPGQYAWQVRARNAAGQSALSPKWVFWVDPASPGGEPTPGGTPGALSVSLTTATGAPGLSTTASGGGMNASEKVDLFWDSTTGTKLGTATANSAGNWALSIQIPDATGGAHKVVAKGVTSGKTAEAGFTVSSALLRVPYQGPPGTSIAITVKGFGANETVALTFVHGGSSTASLGSTTTNASGTGTLTATMPEATTGWHDYQGRGQTSGRTAWGALYVQSTVTLSSSQGAAGASVTATAKGFPGGQSIRFAWNQSGSSSGTTLCTSTTSSTGSATCSFTVPQAAAGSYPVTATANDGTNASVTFGVAGAAALTLTPASGAVGTQFQLSVGGFQAGETVRFTINGSSSAWQEAVVASTGSVLVKSTIPVLTQGSHTISARGLTSGRTASATLTVNPSMEVNPSGGAAGSSATAYVRGMKPNQSISVRFNATSAANGTSVCSGTTSGTGTYSCSFTVPSIGGGGTYPVLAASGGLTTSKNFAVTSSGAISGGAVIGIGTYQVTATQEGLVGGTTSNGHVIVPDDHFVALPACTPSNCPWLAGGSTSPTLGYITDCGDKCFVRVTNPATGICRVEPIWDTGPWFTNDNWWEPTERRNLNNRTSTVNILAQGYPGVDAARDGLNVGYGLSQRGIGISNVGYEVGNRAAIDIADGTWKDIGFADGAGPRTVVVSMLWQTGENPTTARQACLGETPGGGNTGSDPRITISPTGGKVGAQITVTGTGYGSGERVDIHWDSTHSGSPLQSIVANSSGSFSVVITVPQDELGRHLVVGKGAASGLKPSRSFTILPDTRIVLDPLTGASGTQVTVSGQGYVPGETVSIYWSSTGSTGTRLGGATADSAGAISTPITIPNASTGDHYIIGLGDSSGAKASRTFTLTETTLPATDPRISINPTSGQVGATVVVTGTGYGQGEQVEIFWDTTHSGSPLTTVTADSSGQFSTSITVPNDELGRHLIVGKGVTSGAKPSRSFTILPRTSVALNPYSGPAGSSVTVTGQGYSSGEQVDIYWDSTGSSGTKLTTVTANASGAFSTSVTVPNGSEGGHYIVGLGGTSRLKASRTFTLTGGSTPVVDARISIDPTSGPGGTRVVVTGTGYEPNEVIDIYWDSTFTGPNLGNVTANGSGGFTITITVPDASDGRHLIIGKGRSSGEKPSRSFTVSSSVALDARISISPTEGRTSTSVGVTGSGYAPNERVDIYWDSTGSTGTLLTSVNANGSGAFSTTATVPHGTGGRHLIVGKGASSGQKPSRSFYISPSVSASESSVSVGDSVSLTLRGYQSGESVGIYWDDASGTPLTTVTANATGSASVTITIPQTVNGVHQIVATSGITAGGTASLTVSGGSTAAATASFGSASATPGSRVTLDVTNFWSSERVEVYWDGRTSPTSAFQTGFNGGASAQVTVPTMPGGSHTVTVKGVSSGKSATATITVAPVLILTPPIGEAGARIVADVKGWTPGVSVTIYFDRPAGGSGGTAVCTATGRDSGTASCSFSVPSGYAVGTEVPVTAVGSAGSSTTTLRVTNTPVGFASADDEATEEATPAASETPDAEDTEETTPEASEETEGTPEPEASETPETEPTEEATEEPTDTPADDAGDEPVDEAPEADPTEVATEIPTEVATDAPTEIVTEVVTEVPTEEPTPEPTVAPEPRYVTAYAVSDATVYSAKPEEQPGDELAGALGAGGADGAVTYITFSVEGIGAGTVTSAQLVLTGAGSPGNGGTVGVLPGFWLDEAGATYVNLPASGWGPAIDAYGSAVYLPALGAGQETRLDVTGTIVGDGVITFVVTGDPSAIASFTSRESGVAPRLEITVQD